MARELGRTGEIVGISAVGQGIRVRIGDGRVFNVHSRLLKDCGITNPELGSLVRVRLRRVADSDEMVVRSIRPESPERAAASAKGRQPSAKPSRNRALRDLENELRDARGRQTRILVVGRTGVGKSSTINSVLGVEVAEVGHFKPTTAEIYFFNGQIRGAPLLVIDTPGFCDARSDRSNDVEYVRLIERLVGEVDLFMFISRLDDSRVEGSEHDTLKLLTDSFTTEIWKHALIVLTRGDAIPRQKYQFHVDGRSSALREALLDVAGDEANRVPFVVITNERARTPDRRRWLPRLWLTMLERMNHHGFEPFVVATIDRLDRETTTHEATEAPISPAHARKDSGSPARGGRTSSLERSTVRINTTPKERRADPPSPTPRVRSAPTVIPEFVPAADVEVLPLESNEVEVLPVRPSVSDVFPAKPAVARTVPPKPKPQKAVELETYEYRSGGTRIVETRFEVDRGVGPILMTGGELRVTQQIIEQRAPTLVSSIKTAASWVAKKVRKLFGW